MASGCARGHCVRMFVPIERPENDMIHSYPTAAAALCERAYEERCPRARFTDARHSSRSIFEALASSGSQPGHP